MKGRWTLCMTIKGESAPVRVPLSANNWKGAIIEATGLAMQKRTELRMLGGEYVDGWVTYEEYLNLPPMPPQPPAPPPPEGPSS